MDAGNTQAFDACLREALAQTREWVPRWLGKLHTTLKDREFSAGSLGEKQGLMQARVALATKAELEESIAKMQLPAGVSISYLGEAERQKDAFGSLGIAMLIGFLLVYLIMVALYESTVYPFVVMFSIPVALIGAFLALALTMETLSIFAIVGLIMLMGLVAKNGILIVDFANHLKTTGLGLTEALVEAGKERLRPILMTTVAMILGMLPIALSKGSGAEVKNGMAWVIIGGLTSSLFLTLFLVPTMYYIVDAVQDRLKRLFGKKKALPEHNLAAE